MSSRTIGRVILCCIQLSIPLHPSVVFRSLIRVQGVRPRAWSGMSP